VATCPSSADPSFAISFLSYMFPSVSIQHL
jgi:hypothetical protein